MSAVCFLTDFPWSASLGVKSGFFFSFFFNLVELNSSVSEPAE